jgi:hypothetical protein
MKVIDTKLGLCPSCYKFGDSCTCGFNFGLNSEKEVNEYRDHLFSMKEFEGIVISKPLLELGVTPKLEMMVYKPGTGFLTVAHKEVNKYNNYEENEISLSSAENLIKNNQLKAICVKSADSLYEVPLKYSQWHDTLIYDLLDTGKKVKFKLNKVKSHGAFITLRARLIFNDAINSY